MTGLEGCLLAGIIALATVTVSMCVLVFKLAMSEKSNHRIEIKELHALLKTTMNRLQARNPTEYSIMEATDRQATVEGAVSDPSDQGEARTAEQLFAQEFNG